MEMDLDIKVVLGPGCQICIEITNTIRQAIEENKIEAQIEQIACMDALISNLIVRYAGQRAYPYLKLTTPQYSDSIQRYIYQGGLT